MNEYKLLINGQEIETTKYDYYLKTESLLLNPIKSTKILKDIKKGLFTTNEHENHILGKFFLAEEEHIDKAIDSSYDSLKKLKNIGSDMLLKIFSEIRKELISQKDNFIDLLINEGHPYKLALWQYENMINGICEDNLQFYKSLVYREYSYNKEKLILTKKPDGVILVIPPRNAPASNSFVAISALLSKNALLVKPPQKNPISTIFLWKDIVFKSISKYIEPSGIINIITGNSSTILEKCLDSPKINTVFFFGESVKGLEIGKKIYLKGKKPILELSGNDMMIIWEDAQLNKNLLMASLEAFLGSTQICMVPKIFLIHNKIYDKYVNFLKDNIHIVKPGLPHEKDVFLSPLMKTKNFFAFLEDAIQKDAKIICGGKKIDHSGKENSNGLFIQPTLLRIDNSNNFEQMLCFREEIFFPLIPLVRIGDDSSTSEDIIEKMLHLIELNNFGLRLSAWTKNQYVIEKITNEVNNVGSIRFNLSHIGFSKYMSTHGGTKYSGGPLGELNYMCQRAAHLQGISICYD